MRLLTSKCCMCVTRLGLANCPVWGRGLQLCMWSCYPGHKLIVAAACMMLMTVQQQPVLEKLSENPHMTRSI